MIPPKLKRGDKVAVIAPARSFSIISKETLETATRRFSELGLKVEEGKHVHENDEFSSSSIESRVADINWAFESKDIDAIFTIIGGFNSNQLLRYLDYDKIKNNPKILCGYSDITALQNTIFAKTGLVTYSGPHFSNFGMKKGFEYTQEYLDKCLFETKPFEVKPSSEWSDDHWYMDQNARQFIKNEGFKVINEGEAEGTILGANLCTLNLLQGTEFMPKLEGSLLFLEDDRECRPIHLDRDLQSLIHQPGFEGVTGIAIGRFQKESAITDKLLNKIIKTKKELNDIPVISGVDFGHTTPQITFPIGGTAKLSAQKKNIKLEILGH